VGYDESYLHAWNWLAGYCLVKETGGWYHPFNTEGARITRGALVLAVAIGAEADLRRIAGLQRPCIRDPVTLTALRSA